RAGYADHLPLRWRKPLGAGRREPAEDGLYQREVACMRLQGVEAGWAAGRVLNRETDCLRGYLLVAALRAAWAKRSPVSGNSYESWPSTICAAPVYGCSCVFLSSMMCRTHHPRAFR